MEDFSGIIRVAEAAALLVVLIAFNATISARTSAPASTPPCWRSASLSDP